MSLTSGTRLGPYEILAPLGAGGMGEVYKARDTRLGREVAIKVLPGEASEDADRRARFEQEARSASALNHPNIITIHDIGTADGALFIAMELVEGKTLRELLLAGPLPVRKTLSVAAQAADGLAKAHAAGIVHRDFKPENVMVTREGLVKILDFGLAKLSERTGAGLSEIATIAAAGTRPGVVLGTVGYMSPEQASGDALDFRSDQFSLGTILYEMATGERAFQRGTAIETLSAIIREEPKPIGESNPSAPAPLRWILERCLAKDPEERYASTRDLARDLKQTLDHISQTSGEAVAVPGVRPRRAPFWPVLTGVLAIGLVFSWLFMLSQVERRPVRSPPELARVTFAPGLEDEPAWSPDGKFLAYTTDERGNLDIAVLPLAGGEPIRVADSEADEAEPAWSPDGSRLAFVSARDHGGVLSIVIGRGPLTQFLAGRGGDIFVVPALGGRPAKLVESGYYPAWSPDSKKIVFQSGRDGQWDLWVIAAEGGTPIRLTKDAEFDYQPAWSPDGKWIAYGSSSQGPGYELRVVPAAGGAPRNVTALRSWILRPAWSADSLSLYFSANRNGIVNLWKASISPSPAGAPASPARVTTGEGQDVNVSVSRTANRIAFSTVRGNPDIWELTLESGRLRQITSETGLEDYPHLSGDGKTLLVESDRGGSLAAWTLDLTGKFLAQLTRGQTAGYPRWSSDGRQIGFVRDGTLHLQSVGNMTAKDTGLAAASNTLSWSPDDRRIALACREKGDFQICVYTPASGTVEKLTSMRAQSGNPEWSSDGRQIVFQSTKGGDRQLWIVPAEGGEPRRITSGASESAHPQFSPANPDEILFLRDHRVLSLLTLSSGRVRELPGYHEGTFLLDYPSFSPDGKRIFFSVSRKTGDLYVLEGD